MPHCLGNILPCCHGGSKDGNDVADADAPVHQVTEADDGVVRCIRIQAETPLHHPASEDHRKTDTKQPQLKTLTSNDLLNQNDADWVRQASPFTGDVDGKEGEPINAQQVLYINAAAQGISEHEGDNKFNFYDLLAASVVKSAEAKLHEVKNTALERKLSFKAQSSGILQKQGSVEAFTLLKRQTSAEAFKRQTTACSMWSVCEMEPEPVEVDRNYDFFDPSTRKSSVMRYGLLEDVEEEAYVGRDDNSSEERSSLHSNNSGNDSGDNETSPIAKRSPNGLGRSRTVLLDPAAGRASVKEAQEIAATWGVMVAKVLYRRVLGLSMKCTRLMSQKRLQRSQRKGVLGLMQSRAKSVVEKVKKLARRVGSEPDRYDKDWTQEDLLSKLFTEEYVDTLMFLATACRKLLEPQNLLAEASVPCKVFGDIHGQLRDLLLFFDCFGFPSERGPMFVFNGDFVDRGAHQLEVIGILLALKLAMPKRIVLVRGNHEDRTMNDKYGFLDECKRRLGKTNGMKTYDLMHKCFNELPLGCLISDRVLVVHGGIGDGKWDLQQLLQIRKPLSGDEIYEPKNKWIFNILWSDPIEDDDGKSVFGVHASPRGGAAHRFGGDVTETFCARNGLGLLVRSHQSKLGSCGFDVMHHDKLVRVFSARDYQDDGNDGACLMISQATDERKSQECLPFKVLRVRAQVLRSHAKALDSIKQPAATGQPEAVGPERSSKRRLCRQATMTPRQTGSSASSNSGESEAVSVSSKDRLLPKGRASK